jgi:hypothetical protein
VLGFGAVRGWQVSNADRFASGPDQTKPDKFLGCSGASRTTCEWDGGGAAGARRPLA